MPGCGKTTVGQALAALTGREAVDVDQRIVERAGCSIPEIFAQGGMAEGAELILQTAPLPCRCTDCGHTFELHRRPFTCPHCGSDARRFTGGHGLAMTNLEVEPEESHD